MDVLRNLVVWLFFLGLGRETFAFLQLLGFIIMVFGNLLYNEIIVINICNLKSGSKEEENAIIL